MQFLFSNKLISHKWHILGVWKFCNSPVQLAHIYETEIQHYLTLKALVALATLALAVSHTFSSPIANPEAEAQIGPEPVGPVIVDEVSSLFVKIYSSCHLIIRYENEFEMVLNLLGQ